MIDEDSKLENTSQMMTCQALDIVIMGNITVKPQINKDNCWAQDELIAKEKTRQAFVECPLAYYELFFKLMLPHFDIFIPHELKNKQKLRKSSVMCPYDSSGK